MEEKKTKKKEQKNKELKGIKKADKDKQDKKEMLVRLKELNNNIVKMKEQKKIDKKKKLYFP